MTKLHYYLMIVFSIIIFLPSCEDTPDPCENQVCFNGGDCLDGACFCPPGWTGLNCQTEEENPGISGGNNNSGTDPCNDVVYQNGGQCLNGSCDCQTAWMGADCANQVTPSVIKITGIELSGFSDDDNNGDSFDGNGTNPDIYIAFRLPNSNNFIGVTNIIYDANPTGIFNFNTNINITSPTANHNIEIWDSDAADLLASNDDLVCGYLVELYSSTNNFPSILTYQNPNDCYIKLTVEYEF